MKPISLKSSKQTLIREIDRLKDESARKEQAASVKYNRSYERESNARSQIINLEKETKDLDTLARGYKEQRDKLLGFVRGLLKNEELDRVVEKLAGPYDLDQCGPGPITTHKYTPSATDEFLTEQSREPYV